MVDSPFELLPIGIRFMASLVFNPPQFGQVLQELRVVSVQFFLVCSCPCLYYINFLLRELVLEAAGRQAGRQRFVSVGHGDGDAADSFFCSLVWFFFVLVKQAAICNSFLM